MWFVLLIPLTVAAVTDTTDRQTRTLPLPEGRALSIEVTVGSAASASGRLMLASWRWP